MRAALLIVLVFGLGACKSKPRAAGPEPDRNPYKNVMPDKVKKQVEDAQKKEEQRDDKLIENAK